MRKLFTVVIAVALLGGLSSLYLLRPNIELWMAMHPSSKPKPAHPAIVMLGDSHTEFVNWRLLTHCDSISNFGVGGNTTTQILARLPSALLVHPRLIILMAGTNDARRYVAPDKTIKNMREIEKEVKDQGIKFVSIAPPPLPSRGDAVNVSIAAAKIHIPFTLSDLGPDQIHMRRSGYAKWRDAIEPLIERYCGS